ncbi:hypothetical protein [Henriciella marina]|uniref:hypothetical protein n=1 Tax=Henriciella marina TaxID=453851 RepID=UPI00037595F6|nr:hypothetical protein [Henriciella marina]
MPLQNRVDPFGEIHAVSARGTFMGNRGGCFHDASRQLKPTRWKSRQWIICALDFKGRRRELMAPGRYTELFFLDEATALAAGHRPCFECRRPRAEAFRVALVAAGAIDASGRAADIDKAIAGEVQARLKGKAMAPDMKAAHLPDGAMFAHDSSVFVTTDGHCRKWSFQGDGKPQPLPHGDVTALTPAAGLKALQNGYAPQLHESMTDKT